jgi:hypothetical protein
MRDGDWKYIVYYDTRTADSVAGEMQLFNLKEDISESKNLAAQESERLARMSSEHGEWLRAIDAQQNTPNPDFDPALFKKLYVDFDPSRPALKKTAAEMEKDMATWRSLMNEVVATARAGQKAKKAKK